MPEFIVLTPILVPVEGKTRTSREAQPGEVVTLDAEKGKSLTDAGRVEPKRAAQKRAPAKRAE